MAEPCLSSFGHGIHIEILEGLQKPIALKERACKHYRLLASSWFPSPSSYAGDEISSAMRCLLTLKLISVNRSTTVEVWLSLVVAHNYPIYLDGLSSFSTVDCSNSIVVDVAACSKAACSKKAELLSTACMSSGFSPLRALETNLISHSCTLENFKFNSYN